MAKRIMKAALAAVLAVGLVPAPAFAGELSAAFKWGKSANLKACSYQAKRNGTLAYAQDDALTSTYRNKRLVKSVLKSTLTDHSSTWTGVTKATATYRYKKVAVPKKLAAQVEAQQWSLLNRNANYELPCDVGESGGMRLR